MHFDAEYAKKSEFGKSHRLQPVHGGADGRMSVTDVSQKAIANLGWSDIKLTFPLFAGDTLYATSKVLDKRESSSRPGAGIVTVRTVWYQSGRQGSVHLRPHDVDRQAWPQRRRQGQLLERTWRQRWTRE
jgi:acyl dehydratase